MGSEMCIRDRVPTCTLLSLARCQLHYQSLAPLVVGSRLFSKSPLQERVCEIVLDSLEQMPFSNQRSNFLTYVDVLHDLMEGGGDDEITINLRSSEQQIVRSVSVDYIARYFRS